MVQFKDVFTGREQRDYLRAVSSQRCVRAGGKHNDLENVGYTARHHTFFEMLGNFSFGDYFKREAIHFAWDFLIHILGLDPARLWCTVYRDDDEAADMQGVHSNYDIDLFKNLIRAAGRLAGTAVLTSSSLRVIADHIRASTFLVVDGVLPSNEGRGYVLRRIIRRAIRHGYKLGVQEPFFHKLVPVLAEQMGDAYPELVRGSEHAQRVLKTEEERFAETLANGMVLLEGAIRNLHGAKVIDGDTVFKLYDTYGFPVDLTADVARERGLGIDQARFEAAMEEQRRRSQEASKFGSVDPRGGASFDARTLFQGYEGLAV